tara:strand:+ start:67 stop:249 length:183 start_codon:yes stop_codon:yes gene_type:complete
MATRTITTTGHQSLQDVSNTAAGSLAGSNIVSIVYNDTVGTAELSAAIDACRAQLLQQEG